MHDPDGKPHDPLYAYDPRCVLIEGTYYIMWCGDFDGAAIGSERDPKIFDFDDFLVIHNLFFHNLVLASS